MSLCREQDADGLVAVCEGERCFPHAPCRTHSGATGGLLPVSLLQEQGKVSILRLAVLGRGRLKRIGALLCRRKNSQQYLLKLFCHNATILSSIMLQVTIFNVTISGIFFLSSVISVLRWPSEAKFQNIHPFILNDMNSK